LVESLDSEGLAEVLKRSAASSFVVVGIPAFNEEHTIAGVVLKAQRYAHKVLVCDDGSTDMTGEIAESLGAEVIRHERNLGYGAALRSLFNRAREVGADVLVTLDADGQHDPCEIPNVVEAVVDGGADIAIGSRFAEEHLARGMPWYRRAGVKLITRLTNDVAKYGVRDAQSGFRAYGRRALETLGLTENGMGASVEVLLETRRLGLRVREVPASCRYDRELKGSTRHPIIHGFDVVMAILRRVVEERPLVFLGVPGVICLLVGAFFGAWMLQIYSVERSIPTNVALAAIAFVLVGLFTLFTAVTLYAISRLTLRISKN